LTDKLCFQGTEELLRREANITDEVPDLAEDADVSSVLLAAYKSEGDPESYISSYLDLRRFVEDSLDIYKVISMFIFKIVRLL
jgi:transcription initiation factor TFIID subunit 5